MLCLSYGDAGLYNYKFDFCRMTTTPSVIHGHGDSRQITTMLRCCWFGSSPSLTA